MSIRGWKLEFYPTNANSTTARRDPVGHSLKKWRGLTSSNLEKHGLYRSGGGIQDSYYAFEINCNTCALCCKYPGPKCACYPLCKIVDGRPCDSNGSPFQIFMKFGDPLPMIRALEKAQALPKAAARKRRNV